jgi:hypothetical protein
MHLMCRTGVYFFAVCRNDSFTSLNKFVGKKTYIVSIVRKITYDLSRINWMLVAEERLDHQSSGGGNTVTVLSPHNHISEK